MIKTIKCILKDQCLYKNDVNGRYCTCNAINNPAILGTILKAFARYILFYQKMIVLQKL